MQNTQILFKSRPEGMPAESNFEMVKTEMPKGDVVRRTLYLSVDPYMRGRMSDQKSYAEGAKLGQTMVGQTVSRVIESKSLNFKPGDVVLTYDGWQEFAASDGKDLRKVDASIVPPSWYLGVLGMPGLTAYVALLDIGKPKLGETVVVSSAAGAVGSVAGQIAKIKGCRAIGLAGSEAKCHFVVDDLGFDACINYKAEDFGDAMRRACPKGIDVYFDNVGGPVLEAVLRQVNVHARIPLVGQISTYNDTKYRPGPNLTPVLVNRVLLQGMIVLDHAARMPDFLRDTAQWIREGTLKYREDVVRGLENAPRAFIGLFSGENIGKRVVEVSQ
jgi:NADPH-dependent curcumin reductase